MKHIHKECPEFYNLGVVMVAAFGTSSPTFLYVFFINIDEFIFGSDTYELNLAIQHHILRRNVFHAFQLFMCDRF